MAEGTVYVDLSPVINAVRQVSNQVVSVNNKVESVSSEVYSVKNDLTQLKKDFVVMIEENRKHAALQRAVTEIIRIRQELDRDYGNYKQVRDTMIGILSASDLSLVRESTIANITEELMITTPKYWLAPVLIALSAWISDNRSLAERAVKEALKRDKEKTCLTFALICRRNGRQQTCIEWLAKFFEQQKAEDMKESIIAYIDAYTNGVFGEDRDNLCEEYILQWMQELRARSEGFDEKQKNYWKSLFESYPESTAVIYPELAKCAPTDFPKIDAQISRINAMPKIAEFFTNIMRAEVDTEALKAAIDNELIKLVKNYDDDEAPLREEEEYYTDVKNKDGDEKYANVRRDLRKMHRLDKKVDLAERLSEVVADNDQSNVSAKKTAIRFLKDYIKNGLTEFITEKQAEYPQEITLTLYNFSAKTVDGSNEEKIKADFEKEMNRRRDIAISEAKVKKGKIVVSILFFWVLFIPVFKLIGAFRNSKKKRAQINENYDAAIKEGKLNIKKSIEQFKTINGIVGEFNATESCENILLTEGN